jgi:hypothetical protein
MTKKLMCFAMVTGCAFDSSYGQFFIQRICISLSVVEAQLMGGKYFNFRVVLDSFS